MQLKNVHSIPVQFSYTSQYIKIIQSTKSFLHLFASHLFSQPVLSFSFQDVTQFWGHEVGSSPFSPATVCALHFYYEKTSSPLFPRLLASSCANPRYQALSTTYKEGIALTFCSRIACVLTQDTFASPYTWYSILYSLKVVDGTLIGPHTCMLPVNTRVLQ